MILRVRGHEILISRPDAGLKTQWKTETITKWLHRPINHIQSKERSALTRYQPTSMQKQIHRKEAWRGIPRLYQKVRTETWAKTADRKCRAAALSGRCWINFCKATTNAHHSMRTESNWFHCPAPLDVSRPGWKKKPSSLWAIQSWVSQSARFQNIAIP